MADSKLEIQLTLRDQASAKLKGVSRSLDQMGRSAQTAGADLLKMSAPFVAIAGLSVKAAMDFESSFAGVRKTVDATEEQFQDLSKAFIDMSKTIPTTVNELNGIAEAAGQLGIEVENIKGFTRTIADIAVTTNLTADAAASGFARLANITGIAQTDFDKLGSALVDLGNNLATTEAEILKFTVRIAGAGKVAGLTAAEIMGIAGAFASVGVPAERGGTAVQTALIKMHQAATEGGELLETFARVANTTTQGFAKMFKEDASEAFTAFVEGLAQQGDEVFAVFEQLELTDKRLMGGFLSLAGAGDLLRDSMKLGTAAFQENTALAKEAEQRYGTFESQMGILKNQFTAVAVELGNVLIPEIKQFSEKTLIPAIGRMGEFVDKHGELIKRVIGLGFVIGALGAGLLAFGIILTGVTKLLAPIRMLFTGLAFVITPLVGLLGIKMVAVIGAVAAAIIGLGILFKFTFEDIASAVVASINFMIKSLNAVIKVFAWLRRNAPPGMGRSTERLPETFESGVFPLTHEMGGVARDIAGDLKAGFDSFLGSMKGKLSEWAFGDTMGDGFAMPGVLGMTDMGKAMKEAAEQTRLSIEDLDKALGLGPGAADGAGGAPGTGGGTAVGRGGKALGNEWKTTFERIIDSKAAMLDFTPILEALGKTMKDDVSPIVASLMEKFPDMKSVDAMRLVMDSMTQELKEKLQAQQEAWQEHYDELTGKAKNHMRDMARIMGHEIIGDEAIGMGGWAAGPNSLGSLMAALEGVDDKKQRMDAISEWTRKANQASVDARQGLMTGGYVRGPEGSAQTITAHAGELVLNRRQQRGLGNTINITVNGGGGDDPQALARMIANEVNLVLGQNALRDEQVRSR